jgi:hypothetical protein
VAAFLPDLAKSGGLQPTFDFAKGQRPKQRPFPLLCGAFRVRSWLPAA